MSLQRSSHYPTSIQHFQTTHLRESCEFMAVFLMSVLLMTHVRFIFTLFSSPKICLLLCFSTDEFICLYNTLVLMLCVNSEGCQIPLQNQPHSQALFTSERMLYGPVNETTTKLFILVLYIYNICTLVLQFRYVHISKLLLVVAWEEAS